MLGLGMAALALASAGTASGEAVGPVARGESEVYERVLLRFGSTLPGKRTSLTWRVKQRPVAAGEQPPPVRRARIRLPKGSTIDTGAVARCGATEADISARGPAAACPAASIVGTGTGTLYVGDPQHLKLVVSIVNVRDAVLLVIATESGSVLRVVPAAVRGSVFDGTLPRVPLPNGGEAALTSLSVDVPAAGTRSRPLLRTPRSCPRAGRWKFVYDIDYDDPPGRQRPYDYSRCRA
jgi:hypothetical protein